VSVEATEAVVEAADSLLTVVLGTVLGVVVSLKAIVGSVVSVVLVIKLLLGAVVGLEVELWRLSKMLPLLLLPSGALVGRRTMGRCVGGMSVGEVVIVAVGMTTAPGLVSKVSSLVTKPILTTTVRLVINKRKSISQKIFPINPALCLLCSSACVGMG